MGRGCKSVVRRAVVLVLVMTGTLLVGPFVSQVAAQPGDRLELQIGGSYIFPGGRTVRLRAVNAGGALWLTDKWGVAVRRAIAPAADLDDPELDPYSTLLNLRYTNVTVRRRWFTERRVEIDLGFGLRVHGTKEYAYFSPEDPPHVQNEFSRALVLELLGGTKVARHLGFKGGVTVDLGQEYDSNIQVVGLAVIGF